MTKYYMPNTREEARKLEKALLEFYAKGDQVGARNEIEEYFTYFDFRQNHEIEDYADLESAVDSELEIIADNVVTSLHEDDPATQETMEAFLWDKKTFDRWVDEINDRMHEGAAYSRSPSSYYGVTNSDF